MNVIKLRGQKNKNILKVATTVTLTTFSTRYCLCFLANKKIAGLFPGKHSLKPKNIE